MDEDCSSGDTEEEDVNLYSNEATMMTADARNLILAGDTEGGLRAYKKRMYRKMHASKPEEVTLCTLRSLSDLPPVSFNGSVTHH